MKVGSSQGRKFLTAIGAPVEPQGTTEVQSQPVDVHGGKITVKAMFGLLLVRRPILSVSRHGKGVGQRDLREWEGYISTSPMVCITCVRRHCRSCAFWEIRIQETMLDDQQEL